jgi:DNA-binding HxlR family transcriptional regulator
MKPLTERYQADLLGVLSCYDRMIITGTLPGACYAGGMTSFLNFRHIKIFDYAKAFADPWRERIRQCAHELADKHGVTIEHVNKPHIRKEDLVAKVIAQRGKHPGLVHVLSAMEACSAYQPWHDKNTHKTFLRPTPGKCLHYYFYFIDEEVGLCYLRVPTWCPFRLQFYCNGHSWLESKLIANGIGYAMADNAFIRIDDFARAQLLSDQLKPDDLHRILDRYARMCCPVQEEFGQQYHWSLMQTEYSTDLMFRSDAILSTLYGELSRQAVLAVKAEQVSSFLGKKITPQLAQELGSRLSTRIEGTCIKHRMGSASVKIYDKFKRVLRIETTTNDVSFFKHHRKVEHRDGSITRELAPLKKSIYSIIDLREILLGCNSRHLEFLSSLDDYSDGRRALQQLTEPKTDHGIQVRGFNFFDATEQNLLLTIQRAEFNIHGLRRADLKKHLPSVSSGKLSRYLKRLRVIGSIKRVAKTYRYYLTRIGRAAIATCEKLTEFTIVQTLATAR